MTHVYICGRCYDHRTFVDCHPTPPICERPVQVEKRVTVNSVHGGQYDRTERHVERCCGTMSLQTPSRN